MEKTAQFHSHSPETKVAHGATAWSSWRSSHPGLVRLLHRFRSINRDGAKRPGDRMFKVESSKWDAEIDDSSVHHETVVMN